MPSEKGARERILATAAELFYREGVRAVGVGRIADEAKVAKMSLYYHFRSKDELVAAWLERRDTEWMCYTQAELGHRSESAAAVIAAHKRELRNYLARLAAADGLPEPERVARRLLLLVEGAIVTAAIEGSSKAANDAREVAERLIARV